jgi:hypothetical protein
MKALTVADKWVILALWVLLKLKGQQLLVAFIWQYGQAMNGCLIIDKERKWCQATISSIRLISHTLFIDIMVEIFISQFFYVNLHLLTNAYLKCEN